MQVQKSNTLQTSLGLAMSALGGPVGYAGRCYAFFSKFVQSTDTEGLAFTGDVGRIVTITDELLPDVLSTLEDMASKCMTTALEGHLNQLLKRFPGLGVYVEDQELLNYGCCIVKDVAAADQETAAKAKAKGGKVRRGSTAPAGAAGGGGGGGTAPPLESNHEGEVELYLFSRMLLKVWVSSVHNVSLLHGILLELSLIHI